MQRQIPEQCFFIDGLLAFTRLLCTQYKFHYGSLQEKDRTEYILYGERGSEDWIIGKTYSASRWYSYKIG